MQGLMQENGGYLACVFPLSLFLVVLNLPLLSNRYSFKFS